MSSLVHLTGSWWHLCKRNQRGCVGNGGFSHGRCILLLCYQVMLLRLAFSSLWKYLNRAGKDWVCFHFPFLALSSYSLLWSRMECAPGQNSISTTWERNPKTLRPNRWSSYFHATYLQSWIMILSVTRLRDHQVPRFIQLQNILIALPIWTSNTRNQIFRTIETPWLYLLKSSLG